MAEPRPATVKYTILPPNHPLIASLTRHNGQLRLPGNVQLVSMAGNLPATAVSTPAAQQTASTPGQTIILPRSSAGQVRLVQTSAGRTQNLLQSGVGTADGTRIVLNSGHWANVQSIGGFKSLVRPGQVVRLQAFHTPPAAVAAQRSVIVGNDVAIGRLTTTSGGAQPGVSPTTVLPPRIIEVSQSAPRIFQVSPNSNQVPSKTFQASTLTSQQLRPLTSQQVLGQQQTGQPRIFLSTPGGLRPQTIRLAQTGSRGVQLVSAHGNTFAPSTVRTTDGQQYQNQIVRTPDGQQFLIRRAVPSQSSSIASTTPASSRQIIQLSKPGSNLVLGACGLPAPPSSAPSPPSSCGVVTQYSDVVVTPSAGGLVTHYSVGEVTPSSGRVVTPSSGGVLIPPGTPRPSEGGSRLAGSGSVDPEIQPATAASSYRIVSRSVAAVTNPAVTSVQVAGSQPTVLLSYQAPKTAAANTQFVSRVVYSSQPAVSSTPVRTLPSYTITNRTSPAVAATLSHPPNQLLNPSTTATHPYTSATHPSTNLVKISPSANFDPQAGNPASVIHASLIRKSSSPANQSYTALHLSNEKPMNLSNDEPMNLSNDEPMNLSSDNSMNLSIEKHMNMLSETAINLANEKPRKVFLASTEAGPRNLDGRSVHGLHAQGRAASTVPMARITSTSLNSAPEIRLAEPPFLQPSANVIRSPTRKLDALRTTTTFGGVQQLKSPQRFDGFRVVTQDGRVLSSDASSCLQGLQLLSAEGNLLRADELPMLVDEPRHPRVSEHPSSSALCSRPSLPTSPLDKSGISQPLLLPVQPSLLTVQPPTLPPNNFKSPVLSNLVPVSPEQMARLKQQLTASPGKPVSGAKPFSGTKPVSGAKQRVGRSKGKPRESMKARMQRLENALNVQHLVNILEKNKPPTEVAEDSLESRFLDVVEEETCGADLSRQKLEVCKQYYARVGHSRRFIDMSSRSGLAEVKVEDPQLYLTSLLRKHIKLKRLRESILSGAEDWEESRVKTKGKTTKERLNPEELKNVQRHKLWSSIIKKEVVKSMKARTYNCKEKIANAKRIATACMRMQRQRATSSQKIMKESVWRAKKIAREIQNFWKKSEREEKIQKRAKEKVEQEQRKQDIELIEAKRQQRKLNYLITQTELYAHFMAGKMGRSTAETEDSILNRLNSDISEQRIRDLDYYDEGLVKQAARSVAATAAQRQEAVKLSFERAAGRDSSLRMSEAAETAGDRPQPNIFKGTLKTYQLKGMNWLCSLYDQGINGILADEMGLGKTVQSLAFLAYVAEIYGIWGPFLVITPASTLHNWQQELARFLPAFKTIPYWGSPQERKVLRGFWSQSNLHSRDASFHLVITSYQIVVTDFKYFTKHAWQYMVLDEAQAIKSASSQRWKMLLEFKCRGRLLLSGTPIQNTMAELWSLLHFVMPALFDSHDEFKEWFSKDIEGHAEGSRAKVDEKQMSRLHLILKPFMLRRIKKDVEHELTDKVEVLVYCPLTIRQKLLYAGLKQNIRLEELLAGLGLGSGSSGVSSLMNLVMQFRKVCNHPELFERREPRSPLLFSLPPLLLPRLVVLDRPEPVAETPRFSVHRADRVHAGRQRLEDPSFGFLKIVDLCPGELETQVMSLYQQWLLLARRAAQQLADTYAGDSFLLPRRHLPAGLLFTASSGEFLSHRDETLVPVPETISHRILRSRHLISSREVDDGSVPLVQEFLHVPRPSHVSRCVPTPCPSFLLKIPPRVGALPTYIDCSSRTAEYRRQDHQRVWAGPPELRPSGKDLLLHGVEPGAGLHYVPQPTLGLRGCRPAHGWSNIVLPDKHALITDAGKLRVLDGLLSRLKEEGHRVLIYSQMTKMIDLLEEFMSHRQHSYMRLDGSSKIHERRDMVADFQTRKDIFVFLLSTRAGGLGINLTAADTVIFYDSDWNPTVDQQAMDRAHRLGQTKQVTVYRLICKGTIEERILERAKEKSEIHRMVIQGGSFKGKAADLKPKEVVSLLLDDEEIEKKIRDKVNLEESADLQTTTKPKELAPKKRKLKDGNESPAEGKKIRLEKNAAVDPALQCGDTNGEGKKFDGDSSAGSGGGISNSSGGISGGSGKRGRPKGVASTNAKRVKAPVSLDGADVAKPNGFTSLDNIRFGFYNQI